MINVCFFKRNKDPDVQKDSTFPIQEANIKHAEIWVSDLFNMQTLERNEVKQECCNVKIIFKKIKHKAAVQI